MCTIGYNYYNNLVLPGRWCLQNLILKHSHEKSFFLVVSSAFGFKVVKVPIWWNNETVCFPKKQYGYQTNAEFDAVCKSFRPTTFFRWILFFGKLFSTYSNSALNFASYDTYIKFIQFLACLWALFSTLKPKSEESAQKNEKRILQMCPWILFYICLRGGSILQKKSKSSYPNAPWSFIKVKLTSAAQTTAIISLRNFAVGRAGVYLPCLPFCCFWEIGALIFLDYTVQHRIDRVLSFFSSRPNWESPTPSVSLPQASVFPPLLWFRGGYTCGRGGEGVRGPNSDEVSTLLYSSYICTLCCSGSGLFTWWRQTCRCGCGLSSGRAPASGSTTCTRTAFSASKVSEYMLCTLISYEDWLQ